jgi:hypothetical protein
MCVYGLDIHDHNISETTVTRITVNGIAVNDILQRASPVSFAVRVSGDCS